jgi:pyruvate formate lyase activating enzyme
MITLAGLQKHSLIDYPGKVSCVAFVTRCNFQCPYCHNPDLARGEYPKRISVEDFLAFLGPRKDFLDGVVITGGEPTLYPELAELCHTIRQLGLAVKLDTNGSRPDRLHFLIASDLIDYVAMDLKTDIQGYGPPLCPETCGEDIQKSIGLIMNSGLDYEFRTTCIRPFVDASKMDRMARSISGARCYVLQRCNSGSMLNSNFFTATSAFFSDEQMAHLQQIAAPAVENCIIR